MFYATGSCCCVQAVTYACGLACCVCQVAELWQTSDRYKLAAAAKGNQIVEWSRKRRIPGTVLEELYLFLKEHVQQDVDLTEHATKVCHDTIGWGLAVHVS